MDEQQRKTFIRDTFNTVAEGYDSHALRFFALSAEHMADELGLHGDEHLLDVATGTGTAALALARRLSRGRVTAVDFSRGMLRQAQGKAVRHGLGNVDFREMDMQALEFPDRQFDAASCAFGLFFVQDMLSQLRHISAKVRPGGRVIASSFYETAFSPVAERLFEKLESHGVEIPPLSWKRIGDETLCRTLFEDAGLTDIRVTRRDVSYHLETPQQWWDIIWFAGFRGLVAQLPAEQLPTFRDEHLADVWTLAGEDGLWLDVQTLYASGAVS